MSNVWNLEYDLSSRKGICFTVGKGTVSSHGGLCNRVRPRVISSIKKIFLTITGSHSRVSHK